MNASKFLIALGAIGWSCACLDGSSNAKFFNNSPYQISGEAYNDAKQLLLEVKSLTYKGKSNPLEFSDKDLPIAIFLGIESGPFLGKQQKLKITHSSFLEPREGGPKGEKGFDLTKPIVIKLNWDLSKQKYYLTFYNEEPEPITAMPAWKITPVQTELKELKEKMQTRPAEPKEPVRKLSSAELEALEKVKAAKKEARARRIIPLEPPQAGELLSQEESAFLEAIEKVKVAKKKEEARKRRIIPIGPPQAGELLSQEESAFLEAIEKVKAAKKKEV